MNWKYLALALIISLVLLPGLVLADEVEPNINEGTPVFIETPIPIITQIIVVPLTVRFELIEYSSDLLTGIKQRLGLTPMEAPTYAVVVNEALVAVIPEDSKFVGITPTEQCLGYQYGTDNWFECEVPLQ